MIMPGIIPQITEAIAVTKYITCFVTLFFNVNKRIHKMIITREIAITVMFALWQFIYEPSSFGAH
jgi:hypothetical protein